MTEWRWACLACLHPGGAADSEAHALALLWFHEFNACPATAPDEDEFALRVARRAALARYGVPAYTRGFREGNSVAI